MIKSVWDPWSVERPVVFFHDACITHDGWMAALLAKTRWPDAQLVPVQYGNYSFRSGRWLARGKHDVDLADRHVLVVDFSFEREELLLMKRCARSLLVLDHHQSAVEKIAGLDFCVVDVERSGALLALDFFFPGAREARRKGLCTVLGRIDPEHAGPGLAVPIHASMVELAEIVDDYDRWVFKDPRTRAVGIFLETLPKDPEVSLAESPWMSLPLIHEMVERGRALLAYRAGLVESIARNAYLVEASGPDGARGQVLAVNAPLFKNEVADLLLRRDPDALARCRRPEELPEAPAPLRAVISWYRHEDGFIVCSARSAPGGMDCARFAEVRGGGGHARSAGFRVDLDRSLSGGGFIFQGDSR